MFKWQRAIISENGAIRDNVPDPALAHNMIYWFSWEDTTITVGFYDHRRGLFCGKSDKKAEDGRAPNKIWCWSYMPDDHIHESMRKPISDLDSPLGEQKSEQGCTTNTNKDNK